MILNRKISFAVKRKIKKRKSLKGIGLMFHELMRGQSFACSRFLDKSLKEVESEADKGRGHECRLRN